MYCDNGLGTALSWGAGRAQGVQAAGWALGMLALGPQAGPAGQVAGRSGSGMARALHATGARACGAGGGRRAAGGAQAQGVRQAGHAVGARPGR